MTTNDPAPTGPAVVVVARQPIVDRDGAVVGFELLYRPVDPEAPAVDGERMTARVVLSALTIGVDQLVGDKDMYCNAERGVLTGETPVTLPPERTVIEVLETVAVDEETLRGCRELLARGFRIALDDFVWVDGVEPLLDLASIVKIDLLVTPRERVPDLVRRCREYGVRLVAEKVETDEDVAWARELGFDLFQGYAIERPHLVRGQTVAPSGLAQLKLALSMLVEDLELDEVEETLRHEPGLVVQVLQLASLGADRGLRRTVRSLREALVLLGTVRIRQWVALTILNAQPGRSPDGIAVALTRARMCEVLAHRWSTSTDFAFTAGLLSALELMTGQPLEELDGTLDLDEELKAAAFRHEGLVGQLVGAVVDYQAGLQHGDDEVRSPELDTVAAAAFAWAMPFVTALGQTRD